MQEAKRHIKNGQMKVATDASLCSQYRVSMVNLTLLSTGDMLLLHFLLIAVVLLNE